MWWWSVGALDARRSFILRNAKIFAVANQKGGVGKTTTSVNLAASLAAHGQQVLLVDLDPQGNATMGSGLNKNNLSHTTNDLLQGEATLAQSIVSPSPAGYDVIGTNGDLTAAEVRMLKKSQQHTTLKEALVQAEGRYDFILLDCPPSLNMLTLNALVAAQYVLVVMQCEYFALEGLSDLINTVKQIKETCNPDLEIGGILRTMFDPRNKLCSDVSEQLLQHFSKQVFKTTIPRNIRLAEAPSHGLPVCLYDRNAKGTIAYLVLAAEVIEKYGAKNTTRAPTEALHLD